MKIKNLVKLGIGAITATVLLSGCGASNQPQIDNKPIQLPKSNLSIDTKNELFKSLFKDNETTIESDYISYRFTRYQGHSKSIINTKAKMRVQFYLDNNEIRTNDISNCGARNCKSIAHLDDVKDFYSMIEKEKKRIAITFPKYLAEYPKYKPEIINWSNKIDKSKPKLSLKTDVVSDKRNLNEIAKNIRVTKARIKPESVYHSFKIEGGKKDFKTYLRENMCMFHVDLGEVNAKRFKLNLPIYNKINYLSKCITESKLKKDIPLVVDNVSFNYLKDTNVSSNKDMIIELESTGYKTYDVKISNKTSKFIQMKTLSLYYGGDIVSIDLNNIKLAPNSSTLKGKIQLSLLDNMDKFVKVTDINQKIDFGIAGEYTINGQFKNIYDVKALTINSFN